ncbi:MAG: glycosyltransferase [Bryobacterales bacterium]|nr:glycosyltransferase [Bryobacterales bacterium]
MQVLPRFFRRPPEGYLIYDCVDDHAAFPGAAREEILEQERNICLSADEIWASSKALVGRLGSYTLKPVLYVPNGVNPALFRMRASFTGKPILGYVGAIAPWFDARLTRTVADTLPNWQIHLYGPTSLTVEQQRLLKRPNIHFHGEIPYYRVPDTIATFDVGMIPFCINPLTMATNPIKVYEYLAAGVPVVATPLPELSSYVSPGVLELAKEPRAFADACIKLRDENDPQSCRALAEANSWAARFEPLFTRLLSI